MLSICTPQWTIKVTRDVEVRCVGYSCWTSVGCMLVGMCCSPRNHSMGPSGHADVYLSHSSRDKETEELCEWCQPSLVCWRCLWNWKGQQVVWMVVPDQHKRPIVWLFYQCKQDLTYPQGRLPFECNSSLCWCRCKSYVGGRTPSWSSSWHRGVNPDVCDWQGPTVGLGN